MVIKDDLMKECKNMIYKLVNNQWDKLQKCKRADIEFEDLEGEAWWIYSWCLQNYKEGKGTKFTTYLYQQLKGRLHDYCKVTMKPITRYPIIDEENEDKFEEMIVSHEVPDCKELYDEADEYLSYEAKTVLKYIVSREWENENHKKMPCKSQIKEFTGFSNGLVSDIMSELKTFWNEHGYMVAQEEL